jgi:cytochrome c peroxidase
MPLRFLICILFTNIGVIQFAQAHGDLVGTNLDQYKIPVTPGLLDGDSPIIVDKTAAIQLGKALFWDTNVSGNGVACATCHFHAGADARTRNQVNTGMLHNASSGKTFDLFNQKEGANHTLKADDFPFFKFNDVNNINSKILFQTDDIVGSAGIYKQLFTAIDINTPEEDVCEPMGDDVHQVDNFQTRQTTKRNAPTVINAIFNHRNFWDGRANNEFNGVSPFGPRDKNAKIWVVNNGKLERQKISLRNASLASQALGPPADMIEMSCSGRTFRNIAKKLLPNKPLVNQEVHSEDSVLAALRDPSGLGLSGNYEELIKKVFNPIYWSYVKETNSPNATTILWNKESYSQMEANFSFFFGLAIQMYEATLISDQSKLDAGLVTLKEGETVPENLTAAEKRGLQIFTDAHCNICHAGPTFTTAVNLEIYSRDAYKTGNSYVDRIGFVPSNTNDSVDSTLADRGFFNTSVVPDEYDVGLGGTDPWGNPLSYSTQYVNSLKTTPKKFVDNFIVSPCDFTNLFTSGFAYYELKPISQNSAGCAYLPEEFAVVPKPAIVMQELPNQDGRLSTLTTGAFKVPSLRNIELTGPYMHNGGMKSLKEVIEFYNRGGNVYNRRHAATLVFSQGFSQEDKDALEAFLKTLTDERVRWERAPFDHPQIKIPHGHALVANAKDRKQAQDLFLDVPAVGKNGRDSNLGALQSFESYLQ